MNRDFQNRYGQSNRQRPMNQNSFNRGFASSGMNNSRGYNMYHDNSFQPQNNPDRQTISQTAESTAPKSTPSSSCAPVENVTVADKKNITETPKEVFLDIASLKKEVMILQDVAKKNNENYQVLTEKLDRLTVIATQNKAKGENKDSIDITEDLANIQDALSETSCLQEKSEAKMNELEDLVTQISVNTVMITDLIEDISTLEDEMKVVKNSLSKKSTVDIKKSELGKIKKELANLYNILNNLSDVKEMPASIIDLKKQIKLNSEEVSNMNEQINMNTAMIANLQTFVKE